MSAVRAARLVLVAVRCCSHGVAFDQIVRLVRRWRIDSDREFDCCASAAAAAFLIACLGRRVGFGEAARRVALVVRRVTGRLPRRSIAAAFAAGARVLRSVRLLGAPLLLASVGVRLEDTALEPVVARLQRRELRTDAR